MRFGPRAKSHIFEIYVVWPKIGPKEGICPLFWDQKFSPKNYLYFWTSYTQGSPVEFNLDYLGIFYIFSWVCLSITH